MRLCNDYVWVAAFLYFLPCVYAVAALSWESRELKLDAPLGGDAAQFTYAFTNLGSLPVELYAPVTSCGCTLSKWDQTVYSQGESGELKGTYITTGRRGLSTVTITVKGVEIDGDVRRPFTEVLKLNVTVPEIVKISPGILLWRKNSAAAAKTIRFTVNETIALSLALGKISKEGTFACEWVEIEENRVYDLIATPISLLETQQTVISVEGLSTEGKVFRFHVYLIIR